MLFSAPWYWNINADRYTVITGYTLSAALQFVLFSLFNIIFFRLCIIAYLSQVPTPWNPRGFFYHAFWEDVVAVISLFLEVALIILF